MRRIGLAFPGQPYPIREMIRASQMAESAGYHAVWVAEDLWTGRDGITMASCLALGTNRIRIGPGVINPYTRHPVLIALTLNSLSDLAADRLLLGIASGSPDWKRLATDQVAQWPPLQAVRETVEIVRALTSGRNAVWRGEDLSLTVSRKCFQGAISPAVSPVPVYIGASGPRMTQLVGEIGDGLILGTGTRQDEVPVYLEHLAVGAARAGRNLDSIDVATVIVTSASEDGKIHPNTVGYATRHVARLNDSDIKKLGFDPKRVHRIKTEYGQGDSQSACRLLSTEMIRTFTAAGTPADCLRTIEGFVQAGVRLPLLLPFGGDINPVIEVGVEYLKRPEVGKLETERSF